MTILNFLMGWLEVPVMFIQDNWGTFLIFASLPLLSGAVNRKFEDRIPRWARVLGMSTGVFLWVLLVYLREVFPGNYFYWLGLEIFLWILPVIMVAVFERDSTVTAAEAGKGY
ncbi:MAG: hypothetical protein AAB458_03200 [Patescibacteria group bacterium]